MHNDFTDEEKAEIIARRLLGTKDVNDIAGKFGNFDSRKNKVPVGFRLMEFTKANELPYLKTLCERQKWKFIKCLTGFKKKSDGWEPLFSGIVLKLEDWYKLRAYLIKQNRYEHPDQVALLK